MPTWLTDRDQGLLDDVLLRFVDVPVTPWVAISGLAVAFVVGAVHALGPGHGKALIGAYLASARGRPRDAVALGGVVATMHTGSVLTLGVAFYLTQEVVGGGRLEPILTIGSSAAVVAVGVYLLTTQVRALRAERLATEPAGADGRRPHVDHLGDDAHGHDHPLPAGTPPLSRAGVVALASSGGLLPSPAAFLVLATSLAVGRAGYGLALVAAFSVGLAATLTGIGMAVLHGRRVLAGRAGPHTRTHRVVRLVPLLGAVAVLVGGLLIGGTALLRL